MKQKNLPKWVKTPNDFKILNRLEQLRKAIRAENISYGELAELQSLAKYIDKGDVELLEPAGVPEFEGDDHQAEMEHDFNEQMLRECDEADEQKANYFNNLEQEEQNYDR